MRFPDWLPVVSLHSSWREAWLGVAFRQIGGVFSMRIAPLPFFAIVLRWGSPYRPCEVCGKKPRFEKDACQYGSDLIACVGMPAYHRYACPACLKVSRT